MTRRAWIINGVLGVALAGAVTAAVVAVGEPTTASASTSRTVRVTQGDVTATVTASGNLSTATSVGANFTGTAGTVTAIYVKTGQHVSAGQALAKVDDTSARQSLTSAQASLASAVAQRTSTLQGQTSAERTRDQVSIRSAQVSLANAETSLSQAEASRALDLQQQNAAVASAQAAYDAATDPTAIAQAQSTLTQAKNTRASTVLRDTQQVQSAQGQVNSATVQLASAKAGAAVDSQPAKDGTVASANAQVASAEVQVATAQTALAQTVLRAPVSGTVSAVNGVVGESSSSTSTGASSASASSSSSSSSSSSTSGFIVLSDLSSLQVTTLVAEADATKVKTGQQATITFSATGVTAQGTVTTVDVQDTVSNNVVEYGVTVTLDQADASLRLGQTASVSITTATKSDVLNVPSAAVRTVGDISTVTVRKDGKDTTTVVQIGLVGDSATEIISGLSVGDAVVLTTTSTGTSGGFTFPGGGIPGGGPGGGLGR